MTSKITHVSGRIEAVGQSRFNQKTTNYAYIRFVSSQNNQVVMVEDVLAGNTVNSYLELGLEGDFYFVDHRGPDILAIGLATARLQDFKVLCGLKIGSRQVIESGILEESNKLKSQNTITVFAILGFIFLLPAVLLFPPLFFIIGAVGYFLRNKFWKSKQQISSVTTEIEEYMKTS